MQTEVTDLVLDVVRLEAQRQAEACAVDQRPHGPCRVGEAVSDGGDPFRQHRSAASTSSAPAPALLSSEVRASSRAVSRATSTRRSPRRASCRAYSVPSPELAPVIRDVGVMEPEPNHPRRTLPGGGPIPRSSARQFLLRIARTPPWV